LLLAEALVEDDLQLRHSSTSVSLREEHGGKPDDHARSWSWTRSVNLDHYVLTEGDSRRRADRAPVEAAVGTLG
jgi:hypothetical protein